LPLSSFIYVPNIFPINVVPMFLLQISHFMLSFGYLSVFLRLFIFLLKLLFLGNFTPHPRPQRAKRVCSQFTVRHLLLYTVCRTHWQCAQKCIAFLAS
jgi:hypothetical protein